MKIYKSLLAAMMIGSAFVGFTACDDDFDCPPVVSPDLGGNGAWNAPLTVQGATAYYTAYYSDVPDTDKNYWVHGFIVGCVQTTETVFTATDQTVNMTGDFTTANNILIASTPDETDYNNCLGIQLPSGAVRNALNLKDNPSNLGKEVCLYGYIDKYLGIPGMRSIANFNFGSNGIDTGDVETTKSDFTLASVIKSGRSYALIVNNTAAQTPEGDNAFLKTADVTVADNKFNATEKYGFLFTESEAGSGKYYINDYKGRFLWQDKYGSGWSNRPSASANLLKDNTGFLWQPVQNADGRWVISNVASARVLAFDTQYNSYGLYAQLSSQYIAPELFEMSNDPVTTPDFTPVDGPSTPDTPDTPSDNSIYTGLSANCDDWTLDQGTLPEGATYIWSWKEYNGSGYLNASAYVAGSNLTSEAYAFIALDLSAYKSASASFEHASKFQTTLRQLCGFVVREQGSSAWTALTIPTWPEAGSWTFVNSGDINLSAYAGKKIEVGFKYASDASGADTWEIKNFKVNGSK